MMGLEDYVENPLGPEFNSVPWHLINEVDRGMDDPCWVTGGRTTMRRHGRPIWDALVGVSGQIHMHLCEVPPEENRCINPRHIELSTQSENLKHKYRRMAELEIPHPLTGRTVIWSESHRANHAAALRRPEVRAKMSASHRRPRMKDQ